MNITDKIVLNKMPSNGDAGWGFLMSPSNIAIGDKDDGSLDYTNAKSTLSCNYGGSTGSAVILGITSMSNCTAEILSGNILHIVSVATQVVSYPYDGTTYEDSAYCPNGYVIVNVQGTLGSKTATTSIRVDFTASGYILAAYNDFIGKKLVTENGTITTYVSEIKNLGDEIRASINDSVEGKNILNQTDWDGRNLADLNAWTIPSSTNLVPNYYNLKTALFIDNSHGAHDLVLKQTVNKALLSTSTWYSFSFYSSNVGSIQITLQYIYLANSICYVDGTQYTSTNSVIALNFPASDTIIRHVLTFETPTTFPATPVVNITCPAGCTSHILMPMLNVGDVIPWVGCFSSMRKALFDTNIDVSKKKITLTADNLIIQDNNGTRTIASIVRRDEATGAILNDINLSGDHVAIGTKNFGDVMSIQDDNVFLNGYMRSRVQQLLYADAIDYTTITPAIIMANKYLVNSYLNLLVVARNTGTNNPLDIYLPNDYEYIGSHVFIIAAPWYDDTGTLQGSPSVQIRTGRHFNKHSFMTSSGNDYDIQTDYVNSSGVITKYGTTNKELCMQPALQGAGFFIGRVSSTHCANRLTMTNGYIELVGVPSLITKPVCPYQATLDSYGLHTITDSYAVIDTTKTDSIYSIAASKRPSDITELPSGKTFRGTSMTILQAPICQWVILGNFSTTLLTAYEGY